MENRNKEIIRTSLVGVLANLFLSIVKVVIGLAANSIAIVLDAVNNITDMASSIVTIIGARLASKPADKKHPFGYGRIEYLSTLIVALLVTYAGVTSLIESIKTVFNPSTPEYQNTTFIIMAIAVVVKLLLGRYFIGVGNRINADGLVDSGKDASFDAIITASTLIAAFIYLKTGLLLEPYLAGLISLVIIKSGFEMLSDTLSHIVGERAEYDLVQDIKKTVRGVDGVRGAYDVILHNYGPNSYNGSLHVEVPDTYTADQIDSLIREISKKVYDENGVILTAVSIYSYNTKDEDVIAIREDISKMTLAHKGIISLHGFYIDRIHKLIRYDILVSFDVKDKQALRDEIAKEVKEKYSDYEVAIAIDVDFSEKDEEEKS